MVPPRASFRRPNERGQALAELAMILPVVLLMVLGVTDVAHSYRTYRHVVGAAREGARASLLPEATEESVSAEVLSRLERSGLDPEEASIELRCDGVAGLCKDAVRSGRVSEIEVRYPHRFRFFSGALGLVAGEGAGTIDLSARIAMRSELRLGTRAHLTGSANTPP